MLSKITGADLGVVKQELSRMLAEASQSMEVRDYALAITPSYDEDQISAVYNNVRSNVGYQPDPKDTELFIAPRRMIEMIERNNAFGDCDDIALFCTSLYKALGYEARIVLLNVEGNGFDHAICEIKSDKLGEWVQIDATRSDPMGWVYSYHKRLEVA